MAAATAAGVVLAAQVISGPTRTAAAARTTSRPAPTAAEVARDLVGVTTLAQGEWISRVSCVEGSTGSYVCSFARPQADACAVAMLKWTPDRPSMFTVQAAGRVLLAAEECGPVTEVLHALGASG